MRYLSVFVFVIGAFFGPLACHSMESSEVKSSAYRRHLITFERAPGEENYSVEQAKKDFAAVIQGEPQVARSENIVVDAENNLSVKQNLGKVASTGGGGQVLIPLEKTSELTVEYEVYFDGDGSDYHWTWGGKLPGVGGGVRYFGGKPATAGDGFTARFMFGGEGRMFAYTYHKDMPGTYGDPIGITRLKVFRSNYWHKVKLYFRVNQGEKADGVVRAWVDDQLIGEKFDLRYSTNNSQIDTLHLPLFHGGGTPEYFPNQDQYIKIRKLTLSW